MSSNRPYQALQLFSGFDDDEIDAFVNSAARQSWPIDHVFFTMGNLNTSLFIICAGAVKVERTGTEKDTLLTHLEAGKTFGEMSFMDGSPTTGTVTTTEPTVVLKISRSSVDQLLDDNPDMGVKLWRNFALDLKQRLTQTNEKIDYYVDVNRMLLDDPSFRKIFSRL